MTGRSKKDLRPMAFSALREGDTFFSRSDRAYASVIVYAECWGEGKEGRARARAAVRDKTVPNHAGNVHLDYGQVFPVEASPRGYVCGDMDDYRTEDCRIVQVRRWEGFDDQALRAHAASVLARWSRAATSPPYDWVGAPLSSALGRALFPTWSRAATGRLFCSEGTVYLHAICGLGTGRLLPFDAPLAAVARVIAENPQVYPASLNPLDVQMWMASRPDYIEVPGLYPG